MPQPDNAMPDNNSEPDFHFENLAIDTERLPPTASSTQLSSKRTTRRIHELGGKIFHSLVSLFVYKNKIFFLFL